MEALPQSLASIYSRSLECSDGASTLIPTVSLCPHAVLHLRKSAKHCPSPQRLSRPLSQVFNLPPSKQTQGFWSLFSISSLGGGWKIIWESFDPLSLCVFLFGLISSYLDFFIRKEAYRGAETLSGVASTGTELTQDVLYLKHKGKRRF